MHPWALQGLAAQPTVHRSYDAESGTPDSGAHVLLLDV